MAKDALTEAKEDLGAEIATLRKEIETLAGTVNRLGRASVVEMREAAKSGVVEMRDAAKARIEQGSSAMGAVEARIAEETRARPWQALGIAAFGGLLFGFLMRRR